MHPAWGKTLFQVDRMVSGLEGKSMERSIDTKS